MHVHVCLHVERRKGEIPVQAMKHRSKSVFSDSTAKKRVFLGRTTVNRKQNQKQCDLQIVCHGAQRLRPGFPSQKNDQLAAQMRLSTSINIAYLVFPKRKMAQVL